MTVSTYKVGGGFGVFGSASMLSGSGAPGGAGGLQDAATLGSIFLRTDVATLYVKTATANSTADWTAVSTGSSSTYLPPANAADTTLYANVAAAQTAYNGTNLVDGASIVAGFRILLTNLTSGTKTVYIVSGSSGAWTLTADATLTPTAGDEIYIISGTVNGGDIFTYDGTNWNVQSGSAIVNELGFIRAFDGKSSAGNIMPTYASTNFVTNSTSLQTAIGALDTGVFAAIGNRTYTSTNFISSAQSVTASLNALDAGLQAFGQTTVTSNITTITTVDSVNCRTYDAVKWIVKATDHGSNANKEAVEIYALHDGTGSADATTVDYNTTSIISVNTIPTGLTFTVTLSGTGASQVMILRVTSTTAVDIKVARIRL